jgi:ABC-2 type transport system ATP-binding protein
MSNNPADAVTVDNLVKTYKGDTKAVDGVSFSIKGGEIFGLLGPNGAGKTTTLSILATLLKPTSGSAWVNGFDVVKQPDKVRESIGMVFQDPSSDELLTGYENLKMHALMYGVPGKIRGQRIEEVLKLVDLTNRRNDLLKTYSGGMRRRLEIARGLLHRPKILFLDEPTLGLDPQTREHIWEYIEKLVEEEKLTIILTTHYMDEADRLCDRLAIMDHGKIIVHNTPDELKRGLGGDLVRIRAKSPNLPALTTYPYIKMIEGEGEQFTLTVDDAGSHIQEILETIGKVESVELRPPSLNDVFLKYTGREYREQGGGGT